MFQNVKTTICSVSLGFICIVGVSLHSVTRVQAKTATPSASPATSSPSAQILQNDTLKAVIDKALGTLDNLQAKPQGYIGEIQRVTAETITVQNAKGTQILAITPNVNLVKKGKTVTVDDISVGDWAMVIGKQQDDTFTPNLISVSSTSLAPLPHLIGLGKITSITKTGLTFQGLNKSDTQAIVFVKTSQILDNQGNPLTYKQLPDQSTVLLVAEQTDKGWELQEMRLTSALPTK